jgi:hypothetical protein
MSFKSDHLSTGYKGIDIIFLILSNIEFGKDVQVSDFSGNDLSDLLNIILVLTEISCSKSLLCFEI